MGSISESEDPLEKAWQPTLVFLSGESHGEKSLVGYNPWGHKESDMTDEAHTQYNWLLINSIQFSSVTQLCLTLCNPMNCSMPGLPVHHQLQESTQTMSIESVMPSNHLILCHPLLLLPSIFPSIKVFSNESAPCIRWPKYWSFSFKISLTNEHPGLISFRMDWLDLLAVQGTLKSLLQHQSSETSILLCSAIFIVQLSHPCMTTGKTIALTRRTFVDKVMSLIFIIIIFFHLFLLVGGWLLYNTVVVFAIQWHESAMDLHVSAF